MKKINRFKDNIEFEGFAENRLEGATKIIKNAKEKGGDAILTHHHFKVKLLFYKEVVDGKFDYDKYKNQYDDLVKELSKNRIDFTQIEFQELLGKIEVIGELLIKSKG